MDLGLVVAHPHGPGAAISLPGAILLAVAGCSLAAAGGMWERPGVQIAVRVPWHQPAPDPRQPALWWTSRGMATAAFILVLLGGRDTDAALMPVLLLAVGLPALLIINVAFSGRIWPWVDPFDTLARAAVGIAGAFTPGDRSSSDRSSMGRGHARPDDVRPALVTAGLWVAYLVAYHEPFDPTVLRRALIGYTLLLLIGCVGTGRSSWIHQVEVAGVLMRWTGRIRRLQLTWWQPPRGAAAVCGVLAGGFVFEALHTTVVSEHPRTTTGRWLLLTGAVATLMLVGYATDHMERHARRRGADGTVAAVAVPLLAAATISQALASNLFLNGSLLVTHLVAATLGVPTTFAADLSSFNPIGPTALVALRSTILITGAIVAIRTARRRTHRTHAALPAITTTEVLLGALLVGVTTS